MKKRSMWLVLAALAIITAPFLMPGLRGEFKGADNRGSDAINEVRPGYKPWFEPLWKPPSAEVETGLLALQAAIGAGLVGYVIGRRAGRTNVAN
jgi:cobalt/nickel transport protein